MHSPRRQGRWPARFFVALLIVTAVCAIQWRQRVDHFVSGWELPGQEPPRVRQLPWEEMAFGSKQATVGETLLAVDCQLAGEESRVKVRAVAATSELTPERAEPQPPVAGEYVSSAASDAEPRVASRVDALESLPLPPLDTFSTERSTRPPSQSEERAAREPASTPPAARAATVWPAPQTLIDDLYALSSQSRVSRWCHDVLAALERLQAAPALNSTEAAAALAELGRLSDAADAEAAALPYGELSVQLRRVNYALARRLAVWRQVWAVAATGGATQPVRDETQLAERLAAVRDLLRSWGYQQSWTEYLMLEELAGMSASEEAAADNRALAAKVLRRIHNSDLTSQQSELLSRPAIGELERELLAWAAEPIELAQVLVAVEDYEGEASIAHAAALARASRVCQQWPREDVAELGRQIDTHWRNANVRVSASGEFLNLFMPQLDPVREQVRDQILGARVRGQSATSAELRLLLFPDPARISVALAAEGDIESRTRSEKGPVTLYNDGYGSYVAQKAIVIEPSGVSVWGADCDANCRSFLRGINSEFDGVPVLGNMVRNLARNEHDEQRGTVRSEFERRVAWQARRRFDEEVNARLAEADEQFRTRMLAPLEELHLDPVAIDMHTTEERVIVRSRLAGEDQLSAYTPRPAPLDDSLLNVQIHQSAINNAVEQLGLDGRRCDLRELYAELAKRLGDEAGTVPDDVPERVTLELAPEQAVHITCADGRVMLELHVIELSKGRRSWENFTVRAYYEPVIDGLHAEMARTSGIELEGENLRLGDQIALRGIFSKVLSRNQTLQIVPDQLLERPSMIGVIVTQFRIEDGWAGMSLGYPNGQRPVVAHISDTQDR